MKENSIEKDIRILEKFKNNEIQRGKLERDSRCGGWKIGDIYKYFELNPALDHILSDYKRVLKENKELKYKYKYKYDKALSDVAKVTKTVLSTREEVISVQKVKDKIEHYQELQNNYTNKYDELNEGLQAMINVLQERIEEREEK